MTGFQKFIKYAAIAFGTYLSITIILFCIGFVSGLVKNSNNSFEEIIESEEKLEIKDISEEYTDINNLEIDLEKIKLIIKKGEKIKIEGTNIPKKIEIQKIGNTLKISDEKVAKNFYTVNNALILYIPENVKLDTANIEMYSASLDIENLDANTVDLTMHNSYCKMDKIIADNLKINKQNGQTEINKGEVKIFDLESDSGTEDINIKITEKADIDLEYSSTNMTLIGNIDYYKINNENEFGTVYIDRKEITSKNEIIGNGNAKINLESKSSDVCILFEETSNEEYL